MILLKIPHFPNLSENVPKGVFFFFFFFNITVLPDSSTTKYQYNTGKLCLVSTFCPRLNFYRQTSAWSIVQLKIAYKPMLGCFHGGLSLLALGKVCFPERIILKVPTFTPSLAQDSKTAGLVGSVSSQLTDKFTHYSHLCTLTKTSTY